MTKSKAEEEFWLLLHKIVSDIRTKALQEQAQEIKEWLKVTFHFVKEEQEVIDRVFREKYTGKEEGK